MLEAPNVVEEPVAAATQINLERENAHLRAELRRREEEFQINSGQQQQVAQQVIPLAQLLQLAEPRYEAVYERFRKQQPPNFDGGSDPIEAEEWLQSLESILEYMRLGNEDRVSCASSLLKKDARIWWDIVKQTRDVNVMT